jgi:hypothetical protein
MANILEKYGIKEVADVTFYKLDNSGVPMYPVLYLDTLKVSTIEQTAETTDARGGKGNGKLISWDYNKEINVTLEDALFSAKSLAIMFGDGNVRTYASDAKKAYIMKTEEIVNTVSRTLETLKASDDWSNVYVVNGKEYTKENAKFYRANITGTKREDADATDLKGTETIAKGETIFCTYDLEVSASVIDVSANSFPGTYYITGDTFARSNNSGDDQFFQFIIPKAKVTSENTITLEAEGDPSVFNMSLTVLRPADGVMMKLVQYDLVGGKLQEADSYKGAIYHNHKLEEVTPEG